MSPLLEAIAIMSLWAATIVLLSRWKYGLAFPCGLGTYAGAFVLTRALDGATVWHAWLTMAAAMAVLGTFFDGPKRDGKKPNPAIAMTASFIVGLVAWPFLFPGIKTPSASPSPSSPPQGSKAARKPSKTTVAKRQKPPVAAKAKIITAEIAAEYDDAAENPPVVPAVASLATLAGEANVSATIATISRASGGGSATMRLESGFTATWDERVTESFTFAAAAQPGGRLTATGCDGVVSPVIAANASTFARDEWYALATVFARAYPGAVLVEDSLEGLDA